MWKKANSDGGASLKNRDKVSTKYVGMDVHQQTASVVVLDESGTELQVSTMPMRRDVIVEFFSGLQGKLQVTFEEGTHAGWLYDQLEPIVDRVVVCNPRKNALLKSGSKSDLIDARKLANLLRGKMLSPVYHGQNSFRTLKELSRTYAAINKDLTRVMCRIKAIYRSRAISTQGKSLYSKRRRQQWLELVSEQQGVKQRTEFFYQQFDALRAIRLQIRKKLVEESRKAEAAERLASIPFMGPIRVAILLGKVETPSRFRTKRQFWTYCGLGLETRSSADYVEINGQVQRSKKAVFIRGLNFNHSAELKEIFKGAATTSSIRDGVFKQYYEGLLGKGIRASMARLTLARKIAAISLVIWKKGERFDPKQVLNIQAV